MNVKGLKIIAGVFIFIAFIIFVEKYLGWNELLKPWLKLSGLEVAISIVLIFFSYWLRAFRLRDYFSDQKQIKMAGTFRIMLLHNFFNNFIPMRAGEASFPILMQRYYNISLSKSAPALIWFRILDLHTLSVLGIIVFGKVFFGATITLLILLPLIVLPVLLQSLSQAILILMYRREKQTFVSKIFITLLENFPNDKPQFYRSWFWTVTNWVVKLSVFSWILVQFAGIEYVAAWIGVIAGDLTSVLPVHGFAGAGTYEAGVVGALLLFDIEAAASLAGAVNLHLFLLGATILGAGASLMIPLGSRTSMRNS